MISVYRSSLSKTRLIECQVCTNQKWIHSTESNEGSNVQPIKRIHNGNDGSASSKGDNSHPLTRLKNNVSWVVNNVKVPSLSLPDFRKIDTSVRETIKKGTDKIMNDVTLKKQQWKKEQMAKKKNTEDDRNFSAASKNDAFTTHIEEYNECIVSFYDVTATNSHSEPVTNRKTLETLANKKGDTKAVEGKLDEAWLTRILGTTFFPGTASSVTTGDTKPVVRKDFISKASIDSRTRALVHNLKQASSLMSKLKRTEDLCAHLIQYPDSRTTAVKVWIKFIMSSSTNE